MMASLMDMYERGAITADHFVYECLNRIDPANPAFILGSLPDEILTRMLDLTRQFRPDGMITNHGLLPGADQVDAARRWIEDARSANEGSHTMDRTEWDRYQMEARIIEILRCVRTPLSREAGRAFMTAYQVAIEFARRYPEDFHEMGLPISSSGAGNDSLARYIAGELSRRIEAGTIAAIEMQFLDSIDVKSLIFRYEDTD